MRPIVPGLTLRPEMTLLTVGRGIPDSFCKSSAFIQAFAIAHPTLQGAPFHNPASMPQQPKKTNIKNNQNTLKPVTVKVEKVGKAQEAVPKNAVAANLNSTEQPVAKPVAVSKPALEKKETAFLEIGRAHV